MAKKKKVNLALQGGGSHGAFTWGVLDQFLEDDRLTFEGISGTSAGAMNALALTQGIIENGKEGGRKNLRKFWQGLSKMGTKAGCAPSFLDKKIEGHGLEFCLSYKTMELLSKDLSPQQFNPFNLNILGSFIEEEFDFDVLNNSKLIKVFINATNVLKARIKIFKNGELNKETVLATACLPMLFHPVEIEGEYYWDGGYIGNPALFPLTNSCKSPDIIVVQLTPRYRALPTTRATIDARLGDLSLINALMREIRVINFITKLIDKGTLTDPSVTRKYLHIIENQEVFQNLRHSSKLNTDWDFLLYLFEEGKKAAALWLEENFEFIGKKTTCPIEEYSEE
jgi:NTE family protein